MKENEATQALADAVVASGLVEFGLEVVVLVSGGADSASTAAGLAHALGPDRVHGLHVNYGLRTISPADEQVARRLCAALRIDLHLERPPPLEGNVQAAARDCRYDAAERLRARTGSDLIATGHTRTDVAETVIYRLAASPGSRALLALRARAGRVVRPLLGLERAQTRALASAAQLPYRDDESNLDPRFARNRIRAEVLPVLRELGPAFERNVAATQAELAEEAALLDRVTLEFLESSGAGAGAIAVRADAIAAAEPGLRKLGLRALAERAAGRPVALGRRRAVEIARLGAHPEGGVIELGGGVSAICEAGTIRFATSSELEAAPEPVALRLPGRALLGHWEVRAELHPAPVPSAGPELATLDAAALGDEVEVRTWREGDRIRPLGMSGSKSLQDLFTDRGVPRSIRRAVPVITVDGRLAWVAGVAVSEEFRLRAGTEEVAVLSAWDLR